MVENLGGTFFPLLGALRIRVIGGKVRSVMLTIFNQNSGTLLKVYPKRVFMNSTTYKMKINIIDG